jgi:hypothetical protein
VQSLPCHIIPYSDLATLTRAVEYVRLYQAFTRVESVQNHETELKAVAETIGAPDLFLPGFVLAFAIDYGY